MSTVVEPVSGNRPGTPVASTPEVVINERYLTHNPVKTEIASVLHALAKTAGQGRYFGDGTQYMNAAAEIHTIPDGMYVSDAAFEQGRIRGVPGSKGGVVEFNGTPDMVLEIVSESSVQKDTVRLPAAYRQAGISEFWRVDARQGLRFEILRLTADGYVPTQEADGWWSSAVFGRSFRMTQQPNRRGQPQFTLEVRP